MKIFEMYNISVSVILGKAVICNLKFQDLVVNDF